MAETYQSPPHGAPPEREHPAPEPERAAGADAQDAPEPRTAPPGEPHEGQKSEPFSIDAEKERLVWTPPLPQYPARPTRQEPVQYQAPRPQPAPQYAPQSYVPPQPAPPPQAGQPQPVQPQSQYSPPTQVAQHPSMQQPSYAPAIAAGYAAPLANPYAAHGQVIASPPAPKASTARVGRRMARRSILAVNGARKAMFGVRPGLVIAFIAVLLLTGYFAYDKWLTGSGTPSATPNAANKGGVVTLPPETATVQAYLTAMQTGDADAVWNALGPQEKAHRISRGDDKTVLTAVLKQEQTGGLTYSAYHYVAGYGNNGASDPSKGGIYFYVADVARGTQKVPLPMVFVMDDKGQISQVSDQLYEIVLQQLKGN